MQRYKLTIEYCGTRYNGWQRQTNGIGVQQLIEDELSDLLKQKIVLVASGRTDKGVHALGQTAHFDAETTIAPDRIVYATNTRLPEDIRIRSCETVDADFHAQYSTKRKTYRYSAYVSRISRPLKAMQYAQIGTPIDIDVIKRNAAKLVGVHDFAAFSSTGSGIKGTVREIYRLDVTQNGEDVIFEIEGNGFLYNMVRIIVGTLVFVGQGRLPEENVNKMLNGGSRKLGGKTFAACGLCLVKVEYSDKKPL